MIYDYFEYTDLDRRYYEEHLSGRLPARILDAHTHMNLWEHLKDIPQSRLEDDWALQSGMHMTADDAIWYYAKFFPDREVRRIAFPFPIKEAHLEDNNDYIARCTAEGKIAYGLMCTKPEYSVDYLEQQVAEKGFNGFKPYPDMVSGQKGAEIGIFEFLPKPQIALAERLGLPIVMHLPRAGRMPDENNIRELKEIRQQFPNLRMIIAHLGRCYTPYHFELSLKRMGEDIKGYWFDTAAVTNPEVLRLAFDALGTDRVLYGTDEPIFLWHGYRSWGEKTYHNIVREDFPWCPDHESPEVEAGYTLFIYRQLDNMLNELEARRATQAEIEGFFGGNAEALYRNTVKK